MRSKIIFIFIMVLNLNIPFIDQYKNETWLFTQKGTISKQINNVFQEPLLNRFVKKVKALDNYFFPQYDASIGWQNINPNLAGGLDDNYVHYDEISSLSQNGTSCGVSYQWTAQSGYESSCNQFNFLMGGGIDGKTYFGTYFPAPNLYCCLNLWCSAGSKQACFSSYAKNSLSNPSYTPLKISNIVLQAYQQYTLDSNSLVSFSSSNSFTLNSAQMYVQNDSPSVALTKSGNQLTFTAPTIASTYYIYLNSDKGYAYSNSFIVEIIDCTPKISGYIDQIEIGISLSVPYSLFIASQNATNINPNYCKLTYTLLDQQNSLDISQTLSPFSFSTLTGEMKITNFQSGQFYKAVTIQVNGDYISGTSFARKSSPSQSLIISYQNITVIQCNPFKNGVLNSVYTGEGNKKLSLQVLDFSKIFTDIFSPKYCVLSYSIESSILTSGKSSIDSKTGAFQVTGYTNNIYNESVTIKINSAYQNSVGSQSSFASILTSSISLTYTICEPSITGLRNISYVVKNLTTPYQVFSASKYSSTTYPNFCTLSYNYSNSVCDGQSGNPFSLNSENGDFKINQFTNNYFSCSFKLIVSSKYQSVNQMMKVTISTCTAKLNDKLYMNNNQPYEINIDPQVSASNQQNEFLFDAFYQVQGYQDKLCFFSYKLYYKNGTLCNSLNSEIIIKNSLFYLILTSRKQINEFYYFTVTWSSDNKNQSSSLDSSLFQVIAKFSQNNQQKCKLNQTDKQREVTNNNINSIQNVCYDPDSECDIRSTQINFQDFSPFIQLDSQGSLIIKFSQFISTSINCPVTKCFLQPNPSQQSLFIDLSQNCLISFAINTSSSIFNYNLTINYQIIVIANSIKSSIQNQQAIQNGQIEVIFDCTKDKIYQNTSLPQGQKSKQKFYQMNNGVPVLVVNVLQTNNLEANISQQFSNKYPNECKLDFEIYQIKQGEQIINQSSTSSFIQLSQSGLFSLKQQKFITFEHYQIYIVVYNQQNVRFYSQSYLIDLSVYKPNNPQNHFKNQQKGLNQSINKKLSKKQACSGRIVDISSSGNVKIVFNDIMFTDFNKSYINESNTNLSIIPAQNRQLDENYDPSTIEFKWKVKSFDKDTMYIQLNFNQPLEISPLIKQDQLQIDFVETSILLYCKNKQNNLDQQYAVLIRNIKKQIASFDQLGGTGLAKAEQIFNEAPLWLLILGILVVIIAYGDIKYMVVFIRCLQLIILLPGLKIVFPANLMNYLSYIKKISSYDILTFVNMFNLPVLNRIKFNPDAINFLIDQMQNVGYDNRNCLIGLGTLSFIILLYFIKIFFGIILKISSFCLEGQYFTKQIHEFITKDLYFNMILTLSIEGFLELIIFGYLNLLTADYSLNGEQLGVIFGIISITLSGIIFPVCSLCHLMTKNQEQLQSEEFKNKWGALFKMIKTNKLSSKIYYLVYYLRRQIFIAICIFIDYEFSGVSLIIMICLNFCYIIYIGACQSLENRKLNQLEKFNEIVVCACTLFLITFTDWVPKQNQIYFNGFVNVVVVLIFVFLNSLIIIYRAFLKFILIITKIYNYFESWQTINSQQKNLSEIEFQSKQYKKFLSSDLNQKQNDITNQRQIIFQKIIDFQKENQQKNFEKAKLKTKNHQSKQKLFSKILSFQNDQNNQTQQIINDNEQYILYLNRNLSIQHSKKLIISDKNDQGNNEDEYVNDIVYIQLKQLWEDYSYQFNLKKEDFSKIIDFIILQKDQRLQIYSKCSQLIKFLKTHFRETQSERAQQKQIQALVLFVNQLFCIIDKSYNFKPKLQKDDFMKLLY